MKLSRIKTYEASPSTLITISVDGKDCPLVWAVRRLGNVEYIAVSPRALSGSEEEGHYKDARLSVGKLKELQGVYPDLCLLAEVSVRDGASLYHVAWCDVRSVGTERETVQFRANMPL
jgi:hypothetical protein